ncbi:transposase [Flavobacterium xueshanense]|uniref:DDE superfamily endonuclease n=1 Tax=Flavobacterium xueshanense TaxID=935223 RepID=A0A1I2F5Z6_9FLAO|nr:transposase [Flavobacterium xueshanense]SFF00389.1 DDE superfamily endonuclease [Flavobacterium xueshanense]
MEGTAYIDLYFGDQSHFGLTPNVPYVWQTKENSILLHSVKGKYLNVIGLMTFKNKFYFEGHETTFNSDKMISFMNHFADQTFKKTIVILNKSPIHKSKKFLAKIEEWNEKDFWIYFLQPYSQELNLIENYSGE